MIKIKRLKEYINYDNKTGQFFWIKDKGKKIKKGTMAGSLHSSGYHSIYFDGKNYFAHRLAWLYTYGEFPDNQIDHINHDRLDNRISNLRSVTNSENCKNVSIRQNNNSGVVGVYWDKARNRWAARISVDEIDIFLGRFVNFSDAVNIRKNAEVLYGFHKNHGK